MTARVLIPRQETELLAEVAITLAGTDSRILDLCTGSGCVAVSVALKTGAEVTASDILERCAGDCEEKRGQIWRADPVCRVRFVLRYTERFSCDYSQSAGVY